MSLSCYKLMPNLHSGLVNHWAIYKSIRPYYEDVIVHPYANFNARLR